MKAWAERSRNIVRKTMPYTLGEMLLELFLYKNWKKTLR